MIYINPNPQERETSIKTYPLKKTSSAAALILQGDPTFTKKDSFQAFSKNYATLDRQCRERSQTRKQVSLEKRKEQSEKRQLLFEKRENDNNMKMSNRQLQSQVLYKIGEKITIHNYSMPVDPINSRYQENEKGRILARKDEERSLDRLVRAHYLHTMGNSGYNIVTGRNSLEIQNLVPANSQRAYEEKLGKMYSRYRINPENS